MVPGMTWRAALLVLLACVAAPGVEAAGRALGSGDPAPVFQLVDQHGRLVDYVRDYYGRSHLVLTFFPAALTPV